MPTSTQIREHMPVVCSNNVQFAVVDHLDGPRPLGVPDALDGLRWLRGHAVSLGAGAGAPIVVPWANSPTGTQRGGRS